MVLLTRGRGRAVRDGAPWTGSIREPPSQDMGAMWPLSPSPSDREPEAEFRELRRDQPSRHRGEHRREESESGDGGGWGHMREGTPPLPPLCESPTTRPSVPGEQARGNGRLFSPPSPPSSPGRKPRGLRLHRVAGAASQGDLNDVDPRVPGQGTLGPLP